MNLLGTLLLTVGGILGLIVVVVALLMLYRKLFVVSKFGKHDIRHEENVQGKLVLITGASSGVGKETTYEIVKRGATVLMACRNQKTTNDAINEIRLRTPNGQMIPLSLDLSSFRSIRNFAAELNQKYPKIDIVILNAGLNSHLEDRQKNLTEDGFEASFGVNYLGNFLLTHLLLDNMKKGDSITRLLYVATGLLSIGDIHLDDLNLEKAAKDPNSKVHPYANSKLAGVLFMEDLSRRLSPKDKLRIYNLTPGVVLTGLMAGRKPKLAEVIRALPNLYRYLRDVTAGTQTLLHCALSTKVGNDSGKFYMECKEHKLKLKRHFDQETVRKLIEISEKLVGLKK